MVFQTNQTLKMILEKEIQQKKFTNQHHKVAVNVMFTANVISAYLDSFFKGKEITVQQYNVLRILRGQYPKPSTIKLVRERLLDRMSDTSRMIDKLVTKELVVRTQSLKDKRGADVTITEKGLKVLSSLDYLDTELINKLSGLSEEEAVELNNLLDKLRG